MSCCTERLLQKQGDTFSVLATAYEDDGVTPINLSTYTITSQIRALDGTLVADVNVTKSNQTTNTGEYTLQATTSTWPIGTLEWDVKYVYNSIVVSTETTKISVVKRITT